MPVRKYLLLVGVLLGVWSGVPAHGQGPGDNWTLPNLQPITPENVGDLAYIGALGYGLSPRPMWSPDGQTLVIGTSSGLWIYRFGDFSNPILQPDLGQILGFTVDGTAFFARDIWGGTSLVDLVTLQRTSPASSPPILVTPEPPPLGEWTTDSPDGRYHVNEIPIIAADESAQWLQDTIWQIVDTSTNAIVTEIRAGGRLAPYTRSLQPFVPRFNASGFLFRRDNNLWRWNPSDGTEQLLIEDIYEVVFSPDSHYIALYRDNGPDIRNATPTAIWDISGPQALPLTQTTIPASDYWLSIAVHPYNQEIALGGTYQRVRRWNLADRGLTLIDYVPERDSSDGNVEALTYSRDGQWLADCWRDNYIGGYHECVFRETATGLVRAIIQSTIGAHSIAFHPTQPVVSIGYEDGSIRVWELATLLAGGMDNDFTQSDRLLFDHQDVVWDLAFSPDGHYLVSGSKDNSVRVWDWEQGRVTHLYSDYSWGVTAVAVSPDGRWIASGSSDGAVKLWDFDLSPDVPRPDPLIVFPINRSDYIAAGASVMDVAFSPDGCLVAASDAIDGVYIWDTQTRTQVAHLLPPEWVQDGGWAYPRIAFNPDGTLLIVAIQSGGTVQLWGVPQ